MYGRRYANKFPKIISLYTFVKCESTLKFQTNTKNVPQTFRTVPFIIFRIRRQSVNNVWHEVLLNDLKKIMVIYSSFRPFIN